jgi:hypothetical protein
MVSAIGCDSHKNGISGISQKQVAGGSAPLPLNNSHYEGETPFTAGASSQVATSEARSQSPQAGALPHFPPMCTIAQTRSVPRSSFPNFRLRGSQRLIPASLPLCHSERVQRAPELLARPRDHLCYAVQPKQPLSILSTHFPSRSAAPLFPAPPTSDEAYP